jgi:hypothetical protein
MTAHALSSTPNPTDGLCAVYDPRLQGAMKEMNILVQAV